MLKKVITYTDYNGEERTEPFYFNLSKSELIDMAIGDKIDLGQKLRSIAEETDKTKLIDTFKEIIEMSYGVKSEDGRRFIKSPEVFEEFTQTEAYANLIAEMTFNADKAVEFINGIMPKKFIDEINARAESARKTDNGSTNPSFEVVK